MDWTNVSFLYLPKSIKLARIIEFRYLPMKKWIRFQKNEFYFHERSFRPKIDPPVFPEISTKKEMS